MFNCINFSKIICNPYQTYWIDTRFILLIKFLEHEVAVLIDCGCSSWEVFWMVNEKHSSINDYALLIDAKNTL